MTDKEKDLDQRFKEAIELASTPDLVLAPDIRLYLYAYYKRAIGAHQDSGQMEIADERETLVRGFKLNALFQVKSLSVEEAKKEYIHIVETHIKQED